MLWRDQDGRQKGRSFPDRSDAEEFLTVLDSTPLGQQPVWRGDVAQIAAEAPAAPGTIGEYALEWLAGKQLSEDGKHFYRLVITNYIIPKFGALRLADLTPAKVRAWFLELEAEEYSGAMIAKIRSVGSSMWKTAGVDDLVPRDRNPWRGHDLPEHVPTATMRILTPEEFRQVQEAIGPEYRLLVHVLGVTGLRLGEALALMPGDITPANEVWVRKGKTKNSKRKVAISAELAEELRHALPFRNRRGQRVNGDIFRRWRWNRTTEGMNIRIPRSAALARIVAAPGGCRPGNGAGQGWGTRISRPLAGTCTRCQITDSGHWTR